MSSNPNFRVGDMADDVVLYSIEICGKKQDKCNRFPKYLYPTYVDRIINIALEIQKDVFVANSTAKGEYRSSRQKNAAANCVYLQHLIRIAAECGWISEKQRDTWQSKIHSLRYSIINWIKKE